MPPNHNYTILSKLQYHSSGNSNNTKFMKCAYLDFFTMWFDHSNSLIWSLNHICRGKNQTLFSLSLMHWLYSGKMGCVSCNSFSLYGSTTHFLLRQKRPHLICSVGQNKKTSYQYKSVFCWGYYHHSHCSKISTRTCMCSHVLFLNRHAVIPPLPRSPTHEEYKRCKYCGTKKFPQTTELVIHWYNPDQFGSSKE